MVKRPPVHAYGLFTKIDKSYYFDGTGHAIANVDNMTSINSRVYDKLEYGFNVGINRLKNSELD